MKKIITMFTFFMTLIFVFTNGAVVLGKWIIAKNLSQILTKLKKGY